jgi:hypothetical protein
MRSSSDVVGTHGSLAPPLEAINPRVLQPSRSANPRCVEAAPDACLTEWVTDGVPVKVVSERLGHASTTIALTV